MKPVAPHAIPLHASRRLLAIQLAAHGLAGAAVLAAALPSWLAVALLLAVGASLARVRRPLSVARLVLRGDGLLEKVSLDGTAQWIEPLRQTTAWPFLVVLRYRADGHAGSLVLLPDAMADGDFRRLCRWLRWVSAAGGDGAPSPGRAAGSPDSPG